MEDESAGGFREVVSRHAINWEVTLNAEADDLISSVLSIRHAFATSHNCTLLPSLLPLSHSSVRPFLALPASIIRSRTLDLQKWQGIFGLTFYPLKRGVEYKKTGQGEEGEELLMDERLGRSSMDGFCGYMSPPK